MVGAQTTLVQMAPQKGAPIQRKPGTKIAHLGLFLKSKAEKASNSPTL